MYSKQVPVRKLRSDQTIVSFRLTLLSKAPGPYMFVILHALLIEQYVNEYYEKSIKSLRLTPSGAERWYMICHLPSCLVLH